MHDALEIRAADVYVSLLRAKVPTFTTLHQIPVFQSLAIEASCSFAMYVVERLVDEVWFCATRPAQRYAMANLVSDVADFGTGTLRTPGVLM